MDGVDDRQGSSGRGRRELEEFGQTNCARCVCRDAVEGGHLKAIRCLVQELGADVNQISFESGLPRLLVALSREDLAVVRCLVELGATIRHAMHEVVNAGRFRMIQYLVEEAGANMDDGCNRGESAWDVLTRRLATGTWQRPFAEGRVETDPVALAGLLRVLVLRGALPPALVALLSPELVRVVPEGVRLRAWLPAYLAHRRAYLDSRCPHISLLPSVLRVLIYTFERPATTEEKWATGLGLAK
jgi:hypothetical protein